MTKPFADNLIFFDTEFTSLDPYKGEILSVGMVKMNGDEFYIELAHEGEVSEWVRENLLHTLTEQKVSREEAQEKIKRFVGSEKPYMMAYVNQFDSIYTYKLFGTENAPFYWLPLDFASMLFAYGKDPELLCDFEKTAKEFGIDSTKYNQHHALDDAKFLREVYKRLTSKNIES